MANNMEAESDSEDDVSGEPGTENDASGSKKKQRGGRSLAGMPGSVPPSPMTPGRQSSEKG